MAVINHWVGDVSYTTQDVRRYHILQSAGQDRCSLASDPYGAMLAGVSMSNANSGHGVQVAQRGLVKVAAGGPVSANVPLTTNSSGRAVQASSGTWSFGMGLEAATEDGELIPVQIAIPPQLLIRDF